MNTSEYEFLESIFGNLGDALQEKMQRIDELEAENARLREYLARGHYYVPMQSSGSTMDADQAREAAITSIVRGQRFHNG